jgi:hypothetical protein
MSAVAAIEMVKINNGDRPVSAQERTAMNLLRATEPGRHLPVPPIRTGNRAEKLGRSPEETEQLSMFSYALRGEAVKISSRAVVSEISWPFVDQLNVMGEIQAAGKIELLIRLHRSGMSALLP